MTIDEAIAHAREVAEKQRKDNGKCEYKAEYGCKGCADYYSKPCIECAEEYEQLSEWLEELKAYRAHIFSGEMTQKMLKEEYNKAIDDFVNKINESNQGHWRPTRYEHGEVVSETMSYDIGTIRLIAEQLKAGEKHD